MQLLVAIRNNILTQISNAVSTSGTLKIYTGNPPGVGNASSGTLLSTLTAATFGSSSGGTMSLSATTDSSAAASGTPGYGRLLTSGATAEVELTAGVGTAASTGTVTVSGGAIATVPTGTAGTGYPTGTYSLPCIVTGGSGNGGIVLANIASNAVASYSIVNAGFNYATAPTVTVPPPFDLTFNTTISLGGTVTLSSGVFTAGNP